MHRTKAPITFYAWMLKRYGKQPTPSERSWVWKNNRLGDLAHDMHRDSNFPRNSYDPKEILDYLVWPACASDSARSAAKSALKMYQKEIKNHV